MDLGPQAATRRTRARILAGVLWQGRRIIRNRLTQPGRAGIASPLRQTLAFAVGLLVVVALLGGFVELTIIYSGVAQPPSWVAALFTVEAWIYIGVGAFAWLRRPGSLLGFLMVTGGFIWLSAGLGNAPQPGLQAVGLVTTTLPLAIVVHLLLAFPSGRLRETGPRVTVVAGYAVSLLLQVPHYVFAAAGPLQIADRPDLLEVGIWLQRSAGATVVVIACVILVRRRRAASPAQRRVLAPLSLYGIAAVLAVPAGPTIADALFGDGGLPLDIVQFTILAGVPFAFAVAASRGGFARTAGIAELGAWLGAEGDRRPGLAAALRSTLGDPTVELVFCVPGTDGYVNGSGVPAVLPQAPTRGVADIELAGRTIGAIVYDATLLDRPEDVREVGRVVALAVDHERLTVELRASRARIVAAGDAERRQVARDLHDGLQSRLVLLGLRAGVIGGAAAELRGDIEAAIDELRALVHGVMPSELTERGLPAAVEGLADRMPIPVALRTSGFAKRLPPPVESTGYFVVSEALVNAVKHAGTSELTVTLLQQDDRLRITVHDDGVGGAGHGNGTRSMTDRVEALGGRLRIHSPAGAGTLVEVELPCGS